jgi:hypothetical protein
MNGREVVAHGFTYSHLRAYDATNTNKHESWKRMRHESALKGILLL